jgi:chromosome segregation ATPase
MIAESADIKFACSQCGQRMVVEKSGAGLTADCPICNSPVTVPHVSSIRRRNHHAEGAARAPYADPAAEEMHDELIEAALQTGHFEREVDAARQELARQQALYRKALDECERLKASATHAQAEARSFQSDRQQLKSDLTQARQRAQTLEAQFAELVTANEENVVSRQQIENDLALTRERLAATDTQLAIREREWREAAAENAEIVQALAGTQAELAATQAQAAGWQRDLESSRAEVTQAAEALVAADRDLKGAQSRLETADSESRQLSGERDDLRQQVESLRRDLTQTESGSELLDLRSRVQQLDGTQRRTAAQLATQAEELAKLTATGQTLRVELEESRQRQHEAELRAEANSAVQLKKDNDVLRGIVARLNTTLGVYHTEIRRLRRGRFAVRILYALFGLGLLALAFFALHTFAPHSFDILFKQ